MAKTYAFRFSAQLADFSQPPFVSIIYGGRETTLAEETRELTFADALAYLPTFSAATPGPHVASISMARRNDRKPPGFDKARDVRKAEKAATTDETPAGRRAAEIIADMHKPIGAPVDMTTWTPEKLARELTFAANHANGTGPRADAWAAELNAEQARRSGPRVPVGARVRIVDGFDDSDSDGCHRYTPAGSIGTIERHTNSSGDYSLAFENGAAGFFARADFEPAGANPGERAVDAMFAAYSRGE